MKNVLNIAILVLSTSYSIAQEIIHDIDGNTYHSVVIGGQTWMKENLKATRYNDGTVIPMVIDENKWSKLVNGAYTVPKSKPEKYKENYGLLYNYYTVIDKKKLCPDGWHVPSANEWKKLIQYLGGDKLAGSKMKYLDSGLWKTLHINANNTSQFSALPAGGRGRIGEVGEVGNYATWWSSTSDDLKYAWHWGLFPDKNGIRYNPGHKNSGFSVRCIKDE